MQRLSGVDTSFLTMETSSQFGHISSINVFDGEHVADAGFAAMRQHLLDRIHLLEPYRRRLVTVPFGLDNPYWINDDRFDIDAHLRHAALPAPGSDAQLSDLVCRIISRPLDRTRPLWLFYVIEGLEGGRIAHLSVIHHALVDGVSGANLTGVVLASSPGAPPPEPPIEPFVPEPEPSQMSLLGKAVVDNLHRPVKLARMQVKLLRELAGSTGIEALGTFADLTARALPPVLAAPVRTLRDRTRDHDAVPLFDARPAPRTSFNHSVTSHRAYAFRSVSLDQAKVVRRAFGVTLNDVVMATCAGALRHYLDERGELPPEPLVAMVPVSVRPSAQATTPGNRVSALLAELATHVDDPVERLAVISRGMHAAKAAHDALPVAEMLENVVEFFPPAITARAMRLISRTHMADRMQPLFNLTISNVPGPRASLYVGRAELVHYYPVSTIVDGSGLNITVQSYRDALDFGVVTCRDLVPDPWLITDRIATELDLLYAAAVAHAAAAEPVSESRPKRSAPPRTRRSGSSSPDAAPPRRPRPAAPRSARGSSRT